MACFPALTAIDCRLPNELLANGGFEDENICTEYHINCAPAAWICHLLLLSGFYFKEAGMAHSGNHCMGILAGHASTYYKRTFIRSRLICNLRPGSQYRISFFVRSRHNILDSMGICFTPYDFLFEKRLYYTIRPAVYVANAVVKPARTDTGWQRVVLTYKASGNENFIAIGYFGKNDLKGSTGVSMESNFIVLLDDISMVPLNTQEQLCSGWRQNLDSIYQQNERP